ncbi:hypothetical protein ACM43_25015 [Bradyrhizobium sp. CCBAU 45321]|nr:hypothetical protein [Bradyrhizobium sp. CCBAU 45321]
MQMQPKQADEVEWLIDKRDQLIVTGAALGTKTRPEHSSRVPLAQLVEPVHFHSMTIDTKAPTSGLGTYAML